MFCFETIGFFFFMDKQDFFEKNQVELYLAGLSNEQFAHVVVHVQPARRGIDADG